MGQGIFDSHVDNTSAVTATGTNGANAIIATSDRGRAVRVHSDTNTGVESTGQIGVRGISYSDHGVGVSGDGATGVGGNSSSGTGVRGTGGLNGIVGYSESGNGVTGMSNGNGYGVRGESVAGPGMFARSTDGLGLHAVGAGAEATKPRFDWIGRAGIFAEAFATAAVYGLCETSGGVGVRGDGEIGIIASGDWIGIRASGNGDTGKAGEFWGNVEVQGSLWKPGGGFKIDHPLDPENKYLYHSFVESPDMLNIYNGNTITDANGDATIKLPDYFEALNEDFRYQLTVIGQFAQAIVAEEIRNNQFAIKTDQPNIRVSWQVTGIRKDPFANIRRVATEEDKPADQRGLYLHPEGYGKPESQGIRSLLEKRPSAQGGQHAP